MKPYEIWIDGYYHKSGGIRALHCLKQELLDRGLDAWMRYEIPRHLMTPPPFIGLYPEIVPHNPSGYENPVRWLLNTARVDEDGPIFAWETGMGDYPLLTVNTIELDLWKPSKKRRHGSAFWVGKGVRDERFIPDDSVEISRHNFPTREELAEFISGLDYLISFDPFTAVVLESVLVGTPVLVRGQHPHFTREQIVGHGWTPYGVAWSMKELDKARSEVGSAYEHYESLLPVFAERIDGFVEVTQNLYG